MEIYSSLAESKLVWDAFSWENVVMPDNVIWLLMGIKVRIIITHFTDVWRVSIVTQIKIRNDKIEKEAHEMKYFWHHDNLNEKNKIELTVQPSITAF